jgi:S-adenosylhomocysteine hydrolase
VPLPPGVRVGWVRRSSNSTSFSPPWARAWDGDEVVDLAVGRLALHCAEENSDEVLAALDDKAEAVIGGLEAQHKEVRRSLRRRRNGARGPPTLPREDVTGSHVLPSREGKTMTAASTTAPFRRERELAGQTVVVIGGSSGIGLDTARRARAEGADVILTARDPDRLRRVGVELAPA